MNNLQSSMKQMNAELTNIMGEVSIGRVGVTAQAMMAVVMATLIDNEGIIVGTQMNLTASFASANLLRGIQHISQNIASDNSTWKYTDSLRVLCQFFLDWLATNPNIPNPRQLQTFFADLYQTRNSKFEEEDDE